MKLIYELFLMIIEFITYLASVILLVAEIGLLIAGGGIFLGIFGNEDLLYLNVPLDDKMSSLLVVSWLIALILILSYFLVSVFVRKLIRNIRVGALVVNQNLKYIKRTIVLLILGLILQVISQSIFAIIHMKNVSEVYASYKGLVIYVLIIMVLFVVYRLLKTKVSLKQE